MDSAESYLFEIGDTVRVKHGSAEVVFDYWEETGVIISRSTTYFECGRDCSNNPIDAPLLEPYAIYAVSFANASLPTPFLGLKESVLVLVHKGSNNG